MRSRTPWLALVPLWIGLTAQTALADSLGTLFGRANAAFMRGEYAAAIHDYEALLEAHVADPDVTYNLALAYTRLGQYGQAIRYFERTLVLAPRDDEARRDLERARQALGQKQATRAGEAIVATRPLLEAVFASASAAELAWACLVGSWLSCLGLVALRRTKREGGRLALGIGIALAALTFSAGVIGLGVKTDWGASGRRAIVLHDGAELLEGPDEKARVIDRLPEGTRTRIRGWEGRFALVEDAAGRRGSMRGRDVGGI